MNEVIKLLTEKNKTISTMESCTGGGIANAITNIEGSSEVFKFGAVTYSNEYKIKMGVSSNIIDKYTVYSTETSNEMSKNISNYTNSNYGLLGRGSSALILISLVVITFENLSIIINYLVCI